MGEIKAAPTRFSDQAMLKFVKRLKERVADNLSTATRWKAKAKGASALRTTSEEESAAVAAAARQVPSLDRSSGEQFVSWVITGSDAQQHAEEQKRAKQLQLPQWPRHATNGKQSRQGRRPEQHVLPI